MRIGRVGLGAIIVGVGVASCGDYEPPEGFVTNQRIVYTDGLHNENTEMIALDDRVILIFRGGETGQIGSEKAHINVYATTDKGKTFTKQSEVNANTLPGMRDIRDPKLVEMNGKLFLYAISRLPGGHYRDLGGQAWTVRAESSDKGLTWTDPVQTFADVGVDANGTPIETFWGFWRFTKRAFADGSGSHETLYALGYDDGDTQVGMFASEDGVTWEKRSVVIGSYEDVPSEAELQFFGKNQETAVAIVRMDNQGILQDGQSAICTAKEPFTTWECGRRIEQRLDGPTWIKRTIDGVDRNFVVARKHLPCTHKRTAVYELKGDLTNPKAAVTACEIEELKSTGDTAYTALAPIGGEEFLLSWYSSTIPKTGDPSWLAGTFTPADIWMANIDFSKSPEGDACNPPPEKAACPVSELPSGNPENAANGTFLVMVSPVIYPEVPMSFDATVAAKGSKFDLTLQPRDGNTGAPVGSPFTAEGVEVDGDGQFTASLGTVFLPQEVYPALEDPFLSIHDLTFTGVLTSTNEFCGHVTGTVQVFGSSKSDSMDLTGSTFGASRSDKGAPKALTACPAED